MKNYMLIFSVCFLFAACGNNKTDEPGDDETVYSWEATLNDSTGRLEMTKVENAGTGSLSPADVVTYLNTTNSNIILELVKTSGDTIYLKIPNAAYLTQQTGSTGSTMYLAEVVYNLTEIPGIRYVTLDFIEGDHASPGTFNRDSFKNE
jgi:hypothetical protein